MPACVRNIEHCTRITIKHVSYIYIFFNCFTRSKYFKFSSCDFFTYFAETFISVAFMICCFQRRQTDNLYIDSIISLFKKNIIDYYYCVEFKPNFCYLCFKGIEYISSIFTYYILLIRRYNFLFIIICLWFSIMKSRSKLKSENLKIVIILLGVRSEQIHKSISLFVRKELAWRY